MLNFKKLIAASALTIAAVMPAQAEFVLDSFDSYSETVELTSAANTVSQTVINLSNGVTADYDVTSGAAFITVDNSTYPNSGVQNGVLSYSASNTTGTLSISWFDADGVAGSGFASGAGNSVDLTALGDSIFIDFFDAVDGDFTIELVIEYFDGITTQLVNYVFGVDDGTDGTVLVNFNQFAGVDWTQVVSITANITGLDQDNDFDIDAVGIVPEPSALAILGLGLIGLGLRRRKLI